MIDSWARGIVPETSELLGEEDEVATPTTSLNHRDTDSVSHTDQETPAKPEGDTVSCWPTGLPVVHCNWNL